MHRTRYFCVAILCANAQGAVATWSPGIGGNGHTYESVVVPGGIAWTDARAQAEAQGGYLASATSQSENTFIYDSLASDPAIWSAGGMGPWLGGLLVASHWTWVSGEPWSYANWGFGNPSGGQEQCLQYYNGDPSQPSPLWNDHVGYAGGASGPWLPSSFIIEFVPSPTCLWGMAFVATAAFHRRRSAPWCAGASSGTACRIRVPSTR